MSYIPNSGSVVAFQGNPSVLQAVVKVSNPQDFTGSIIAIPTGNQSISGIIGASIIGLPPFKIGDSTNSSVIAVITGGSIVAVVSPPANQSVSGTVNIGNFPTTQNVSGSVVAFQGTTPWAIAGSVASQQIGTHTVSVVSANPSSMLVGASIIGLTPVNVTNFPTTQNVSGSVVAFINGTVPVTTAGSVVAFQGTSPWVISSIYGNISGSVVATISGTPNVNVAGSVVAFVSGLQGHSVSGTVNVGNFPTTQNISGSVVAFGTLGASIIGLTPIQVPGSVAVAIVSGSVAVSITPTANQSVSGTVGASIIGLTPVNVTNFPTTQNISGSVVAFGFPVTQNVSGSVIATGNVGAGVVDSGNPVKVGGKFNASTVTLLDLQRGDLQLDANGNLKMVGTVTVTALQGHSVSGTVAVSNFPTTQNVSGSVVAFISGTPNVNVAGSVVAFVSGFQGQSVSGTVQVGNFPTTQNVSGSVVGFQGTIPWVIQSIVGTYAEDATHTTGDKGLMHLGVRNDTGSVIAGTDLDYLPFTTDSAGQLRTTQNSWVPTLTSVKSSITTVTILSPNQNRRGATIYNTAGTNLFVNLGTTAQTSIYTVLMNPTDYYEVPFGYVGAIAGIANSTAGLISINELT